MFLYQFYFFVFKLSLKGFLSSVRHSRFFTKNSSVFPLNDEAANRRMSFFSPDRPVSVEKKNNIFPVYNKKSIFTWSKKFLLFSFFEGSVIFPVFQTANRRMDLTFQIFCFLIRKSSQTYESGWPSQQKANLVSKGIIN